jgi:hypothetical protein
MKRKLNILYKDRSIVSGERKLEDEDAVNKKEKRQELMNTNILIKLGN